MKVLTNRSLQFISGTLLVFVLVFTGGSIAFATMMRSSPRDAGEFLRSAISSKMLSSDGSLLADLHGEIDRDPVPLAKIPADLRHAVIAIEDRRFYHHNGIDPRGIARAFLNNARSSGRQGGSTITQQLAKNMYFSGERRTFGRKFSEAFMALGIERMATKDQILDAYLNTAYFGRGAYGVQTAARSYFRKELTELTLAESAFLAGLIHMPARYDFTATDAPAERQSRKGAARVRRNVVLHAMTDAKYIGAAEERRAATQPLQIAEPRDPRWTHPYFVDAVLRELGVLKNRGAAEPDDRFDFLGDTHTERAQAVYQKGLRIYTTLDPDAQRNAERALTEQLPPGTLPKLSAALVTVEPGTGFVRSLIGGRDYYPKGCEEADPSPMCRYAKVNLALGNVAGGSGRQPGSSFKPIVLAAALEDGLSLRQILGSSPFTVDYDGGTWKVQNYEGSGGGQMSVVDATVHSVNAAYGRLEVLFLGEGKATAGSAKVARIARKLGFDFPTARTLRRACGDNYNRSGGCTPADNVPAIALGAKEVSPLQMAGAYATFANEGIYTQPTFITKITDSKGKVIYRAKTERHRAISRDTAHGVSHVLQQVVQRGTGRRAALDRPVAGKTGTSQAWRDAWFAGYVPQLTTVVWVGNPIPEQDRYGNWSVESMTPSNGYGIKVVGGSYPAMIWNADMSRTLDGVPVLSFDEAPPSLFGPSKKLKGKLDEEIDIGSGLRGIMQLRRSGKNVVVHRACPPGDGGRGIQTWKTEQRGDEVHVWRSRAVC